MIRTVVEMEPFHCFFLKTRTHMRGPLGAPRPGNSQSFSPSEASKIDIKINLVFFRFGPDFDAKMDPKSIPKPTPRRSKNDLETDTPKT